MMYHVRLLGGDLEKAHYEPDFRPQKDPVMISVPTLRLSEDKIWRSDFTDLNFAPIFLFGAIIQLGMSLFSTRVAQALSSQQAGDCNHSPNKIVPTVLGPVASVFSLQVSMRQHFCSFELKRPWVKKMNWVKMSSGEKTMNNI